MKLLFITEYFPATTDLDVHGGVEARVYYLVKELARRHEVTVLTSRERDKPELQFIHGVCVRRVGASRNYTASKGEFVVRVVFTLLSLRQGLKIDFDLIEGTGYMGWFPARFLAFIKRKKCVLWVPDIVENNANEDASWISRVLIWLQERALSGTNACICISRAVQEKLMKHGIKSQQTQVIYCAVDLKKIRSVRVKKNINPVIIAVSRLVPYKRICDLLAAFSQLKKKYPLLKLKIIGVGEDLSSLQSFSRKKRIISQVKFHGFISNHRTVLSLIKNSYIFCSPSVVEGFGIAPIEALALGVPTVLTDIAVFREITQGRGGLFFKPLSISHLTKQIDRLLTDKHLYKKFSQSGPAIAARYTIEKMVEQTERFYADLCTH